MHKDDVPDRSALQEKYFGAVEGRDQSGRERDLGYSVAVPVALLFWTKWNRDEKTHFQTIAELVHRADFCPASAGSPKDTVGFIQWKPDNETGASGWLSPHVATVLAKSLTGEREP